MFINLVIHVQASGSVAVYMVYRFNMDSISDEQ
jgi:hypothetical protein